MKSLPALVSLLLLLAADMPAQAPGSIDAEGNKYFPNGAGRYPLRRKGIWQVQRLSNPTGNLSRVPVITPSELQSLNRTLDALSAIFKSTPESQVLRGLLDEGIADVRLP